MNFKSVARSFFRKSGFDVVRFHPELYRPFSILALLVRDHIANGKPFYFVQVGANDGVLCDPLRDLIFQNRLAGLLIEPLPDIFDKLKQNYRTQSQLLFENVAIVSHDEVVPIFRVRNDIATPHHWMQGIASFNRKNLLKQGVRPEQIETVLVQGTSLHALLAKHEINKVNLLQIDTEGYDFEVISSAFDAGIFPDIINYEHIWLVPDMRFKCKQMLDKHNYQFVEVGNDTLAIRLVQ